MSKSGKIYRVANKARDAARKKKTDARFTNEKKKEKERKAA